MGEKVWDSQRSWRRVTDEDILYDNHVFSIKERKKENE